MKILYVEDNLADGDLAARALRQAGWEVVRALTLAEARAHLAAHAVEAVLCDLNLPDGEGLSLLPFVRERCPRAAFVMLTGSGGHEAALHAIRAGADDFLIKHHDSFKRLAGSVQSAIRRASEVRAAREAPMRVMYVEHRLFDADLARRHVAHHAPQIQLECLDSGQALLQRLADAADGAARACDILMIDADLIDVPALELSHRAREVLGDGVPQILVAAEGDAQEAAQALLTGFADYLIKQGAYLQSLPSVLQTVWRGARLAESAQRLEQMLGSSPIVLYALDAQGQVRWISANVERELGFNPDAVMARDWWAEHLHADDRHAALALRKRQMAGEALVSVYRLRDPAGRQRWVRDELRAATGPRGNVELVGCLQDVSVARAAEERVRLLAAAVEGTSDGVLVTDLDWHIVLVNRAFTHITGYDEHEVLGQSPRVLRSDPHAEAAYEEIAQTLADGGHWQGEIWNRRRNGERYPQWTSISRIIDAAGHCTHYMMVMSDVTRLKRAEENADRLAHFDSITGLPNRLLLASRLAHAVALAARRNERVAVLLLDLDNFKTLNDGLGHAAGDALLNIVAMRLGLVLRAEDTLGRQGGDEFLILLEHVENPQEAARAAERVLDSLKEPARLPFGKVVFAQASLGIALFPDDGSDAAELIQHADAALYQAKRAGRNCYRFYTETLTAAATARLSMETRIRQALEDRELTLWYQPLVALADNRVVGAEALLRWIPEGGEPISPAVFIPLIEETGLICPVGEWVTETAAAQAQAWLTKGLPFGTVAVNVSAQEIRRGDLAQRVRHVLRKTGLPAAHLELEITESGMMEQGDAVEKLLLELKAMGVHLAIDDFGTGYSSLAYLRRLPVDKLKVDRSFIAEIPDRESDCQLTATIIAMAQNLHLSVLAEGVETPAQLAFLRERGCDAYQGYLFGRPVPPEEFEQRFLRGA